MASKIIGYLLTLMFKYYRFFDQTNPIWKSTSYFLELNRTYKIIVRY